MLVGWVGNIVEKMDRLSGVRLSLFLQNGSGTGINAFYEKLLELEEFYSGIKMKV